MDGEEIFFLSIWRATVIGAVLIAMSVAGCTMHQNSKVAEAIKNGIPAERARVAFSSRVSDMEIAVALLTSVMKPTEPTK